jgi:serine protease
MNDTIKEWDAWAKERAEDQSCEPNRVVIKFRNNSGLEYVDYINSPPPLKDMGLGSWEELMDVLKRKDLILERLLTSVSPKRIRELVETAPKYYQKDAPDFLTYFAVTCPINLDPVMVLKVVKTWKGVEKAYVEKKSGDPPSVQAQPHLESAALGGVDAKYAHSKPSGKGDGVKFVDIEQGWEFDKLTPDFNNIAHVDLPAGITLLPGGCNQNFFGHGTAVLGLVGAVDNSDLCIGIAPNASVQCISQYRKVQITSSLTGCIRNIADAISLAVDFFDSSAISAEDKKGVVLIEAQLEDGNGNYIPVETEDAIFEQIQLATARGITVIEAAGDGGINIDGMLLGDSGAVLVGAGDPAEQAREGGSNSGNRIDCYSRGIGVVTIGDGGTGFTSQFTTTFGGTSSAAAIVAGVALIIQSHAQHVHGERYGASQMRDILRTKPNPGDTVWMPDLKRIIDNLIPSTVPIDPI